MKRSTKVLRDTLKRYSVAYGVVILISIINIIVFWLYNIFAEPLIYSSIIGFVVVAILTLLSFLIGLKKASEREQLVSNESGRGLMILTLRLLLKRIIVQCSIKRFPSFLNWI